MNRYVLTIYANYIIVLQVLDTDGPLPAIPLGEPDAAWRDVTGDTTAQPGMRMDYGPYGVTFSAIPVSEHEWINNARMQQRFDAAERWLRFNPLQYRLDLGIASPADEAALVAYKQYVVAVSEVKNQSVFPVLDWPVAPF
ncbi:tail fiber assembly protein [Pseudomonas glycinae]|uniref:tail fiber assembly protein n=1 Tax=Pseudomonas glycinae TaxID=1785145 RepID=UPI000D257244|nr:tail fiber assembly protein [Pseudomonas glycinae]AWA38155.1 hypothetical protein DBV33_05965 [Pseudomonas fluorescens]NKF28910.1 tail fiber assembly protein [Pseudomonas sp. BG5]